MNVLENFHQRPLYNQFLFHLRKKYPEEYDSFSNEQIQDHFETIFILGLTQSKKFLKTKRSCHLLYNGHAARADMMSRLGNILFELKDIETFPIVLPLKLRDIIKKVIGSDKRYTKKYLDWILTLSNYQAVFNRVDLTILVSVFPEEMIIGREW